MSLAVTFPDAELVTKNLLRDLMALHEPEVTVAVGVPTDWTPASPAHLQVVWDGTPLRTHPVIAHATVRVVARATTTSEAKRLAGLAEGLLLAHGGGDGIASIRPLAGVLAARDPETRAELASISVRVTVRSIPIPNPISS